MDVTIVILTKNAEATIAVCLAAIRQQSSTHSHEVLLVDSGSMDKTLAVAKAYGAQIHSIPPADFNYGLTKNLGAQLSRGEIVVYLSQDNVPANETWLEQLLRPFDDPAVSAVQGLWRSGLEGHYWWRKGGFWFTREIRRWLKEFGFGLSSTNLAIRKRVLQRTPFRDVPVGEDRALQRDFRDAGLRIEIARDSFIIHTHKYNVRQLCRRLENEGLAARASGARYSALDMVRDWFHARTFATWIGALLRGEMKTSSEILFPWIRPIMIYKGSKWSERYVWEKELT